MHSPHRNIATGIIIAIATIMLISISADAKVVERIVAVVNGDIITETDLNAFESNSFDPMLYPGMASSHEAERKQALDDLIEEKLLEQAVEKSDIAVSDEDLSRAIHNVLVQNHMTLSQLQDELSRKGMTYDEYKEELKLEIKKIKFINQVISPEVKITDRDLRDYFQRNRATLYGGAEVHMAEIILPTAGITTKEAAMELRDRAVSIVEQSRKNGSAFAKLAKQFSEGPNAAQGGDMGTIKLSDLPDAIAKYVKQMPEGAISDPLPTEAGIVIVKVINWPEVGDGDFNAVRDNIYQKLYEVKLEDATDSYVQRLRQRSYVEVR